MGKDSPRQAYPRTTRSVPLASPPKDAPKRTVQSVTGMASTEIDFKTYEDGSTAVRIQRNKGRFEDGYNGVDRERLHATGVFPPHPERGKTDYEAGSRTDDQMRELFKPTN